MSTMKPTHIFIRIKMIIIETLILALIRIRSIFIQINMIITEILHSTFIKTRFLFKNINMIIIIETLNLTLIRTRFYFSTYNHSYNWNSSFNIFRSRFEPRWLSALSKLDLPVMLLWGDSDAVAPMEIPKALVSKGHVNQKQFTGKTLKRVGQ